MSADLPNKEDAKKPTPQAQTGDAANDVAKPETREGNRDLGIVGRFDKYRSSYWAGMIAALSTRYFPKPFCRPFFDASPDKTSHLQKHAYAAISGVALSAVTGFYAVKTYADMKTILSEVVGWEKNKDPKDVNFFDLWNSKNSVVQQTMKNYVQFNIRRFGVNLAFFTPFLFPKTFQKYKLSGETGVDFGVGANAVYLFHDILKRKMTPFEEVQTLIDTKINHSQHFSDPFVATDLLDIYERHAELSRGKNKSFMPQRGTPQWDQSMALFERMSSLMNQSYHNDVPHEHARFGFSKFMALLGNGLIDPDHIERSRAYLEIANQYGGPELLKSASEHKNGKPMDEVLKRYPLAVQALQAAPVEQAPGVEESAKPAHKKIIEKSQPISGFANREAERVASTPVMPHAAI